MTVEAGVDLRQEVIAEDRPGFQPVTWRESVWEWREWYGESIETAPVFENLDGDQVKGSRPNRFHPDSGDRTYAKLKDLQRGISADYGKRLYTAMLSLTASSTDDQGRPLPPVDHLNELLSSWEAVRRALARVLDERRWEYLAILEPHESGYLHVHIAVFVDGRVTQETFEPVVEAHLRNCDLAGDDAHDVSDDSTISVRWAGGDRDVDGDHLDELAIYLAEYLGTFGDDPRDEPEHVQMSNAILWATERQRWRPSNGAQRYMSTNRSEGPSEWELVGIEDGEGEIHEVDPGMGGVSKISTWIPPPPGD